MAATASPLKREFLKGLAVALPIAFLQPLLLGWLGSFSSRPWTVTAVLLPLAVALGLLGWPLLRQRRLVLGGGSLAFFFAYCLLFSFAAGTDLLNGRRTPLRGYDDATPTNFLGLSRLGDWHYWLASEAPPALDLAVVTFPSFDGVETWKARRTHADLISLAVAAGAKGIAFDYVFQSPEGPADPIAVAMNRALCAAIGRAEEAGVPVIVGYAVNEVAGRLVPEPLPEELEACIPEDRRGSFFGYRESDNRVRIVPLFRSGDEQYPSFSYRVANSLTREPMERPRGDLLQFLRPSEPPLTIEADFWAETGGVAELLVEGAPELGRDEAASLLSGTFVFAGSRREGDRQLTPYGPLPGVMVHALAAHGLRRGVFIHRLDRRWIFPTIFVLCYLLTAVQATGAGRPALLLASLALSAVVLVAAASVMRFGNVWIDVSYPLVAVWLLTGGLLGGAAWEKTRRQATAPATEIAREGVGAEPFDVFLSHNSRDKPVVRRLGEELKSRGLKVWLDEWELVPGRPWQEGLEQVIETARSAAVLVGADGLGPWEVPEMRACLDECVRRQMAVIPVLLPGAGERPDLPLFLRGLTWVDLRGGLHPKGMDRLEWGITGVKPRRRRAAA